jgi:EAL domain-containing protein (putative c-di-GMP-specific phosphodiesterase class I)
MVFQPIVLLSRGTVAAYEALGRGRHPQLPESPLELLRIAESIGAAAELSRLFRRKAVELTALRTDLPTIFLNTHPIEMARPGLLESLEELREVSPQLDLALEIHESVSRARPRSPSSGSGSPSATSPSPTTTSARAGHVSTSSPRRRRTT